MDTHKNIYRSCSLFLLLLLASYLKLGAGASEAVAMMEMVSS